MTIKRQAKSEEEVEDVLTECEEAENNCSSRYPGMSYEQGVRAGIRWALGIDTNDPLSE